MTQPRFSGMSAITSYPSNRPADPPAPQISSLQLLGEQGLLRIAHQGGVYTLRTTSKGGLILTK
jgi:hemin uptake protein HemP